MNILVTGSSGWLGQTLVPRLSRDGHRVVGLDPEPGPTTEIVGSVVDRAVVRRIIREQGIEAIVHAAARHKPHIETHDNSEFVAVNVVVPLTVTAVAQLASSKPLATWYSCNTLYSLGEAPTPNTCKKEDSTKSSGTTLSGSVRP